MDKRIKAAIAGLAFVAGCEIGIALQLVKMIHNYTIKEAAGNEPMEEAGSTEAAGNELSEEAESKEESGNEPLEEAENEGEAGIAEEPAFAD